MNKMKKKLSHIDDLGRAKMVDVAEKPVTHRQAVAEASLKMQASTLALLLSKNAPKGDVLAAARIAGIQAAKRTHELIPLCHALALLSVGIVVTMVRPRTLVLTATVRCDGKTGVEMEALVAASIAALTVYDMLKAVDRGMEITHVRLLEKSGGRSGVWKRGK